MYQMQLAEDLKSIISTHATFSAKWPINLHYERNKSLVSPSKATFMQMDIDKKLDLIAELDKLFLDIMTLYDSIYYREANVHFTDSEVGQFQANLKSGLLCDRELTYYAQKRVTNRPYFKDVLENIFKLQVAAY